MKSVVTYCLVCLFLVTVASPFCFAAEDMSYTYIVPSPPNKLDPDVSRPKLEPQALDGSVTPNARVNDRTTCGDGSGITQSETAIAAIDNVVVVAYNDSRGLHCSGESRQTTGWGYSMDGGLTFTQGGTLPDLGERLHGDPWLATGPDGTFYLTSLVGPLQGLALHRGAVSNGTIVWSEPTIVRGFVDKEAIAVDPNSGNIYISYTAGFMQVIRSTDGGQTFSSPVTIGFGQGSFPVVGNNGEVYVAWNSLNRTVLARSYNGGVSFTGVTIANVCNFPIPGFNRGNSFGFPSVAVDRTGGERDGYVYVVWDSRCPTGNGDIFLSRSADRGQTWSVPVRVNDDATTALQFFPTVNVDANGNVNVLFYDRRENPGTAVTNLYLARSSDGGISFDPNVRVTSIATDWSATVADAIPNFGDYINSTATGNNAFVAWADGREADPDVYVSRISLPGNE